LWSKENSGDEITKISQTKINKRIRKYLFLLVGGILFIIWLLVIILLTRIPFLRFILLILIISTIIILIISRPPPAEPIPMRFEGPKASYQPLPKSQP